MGRSVAGPAGDSEAPAVTGAGCDGQVQVVTDLLGLGSFIPRHARPYASLRETIRDAASRWAADVGDGSFPGPEQATRMEDTVLDGVLGRTGDDRVDEVDAGGPIPLDRDL